MRVATLAAMQRPARRYAAESWASSVVPKAWASAMRLALQLLCSNNPPLCGTAMRLQRALALCAEAALYMVTRSTAPPPPPKVNGPDIGWGSPSPVVWGVESLFPLWGSCGVSGFLGFSLSF